MCFFSLPALPQYVFVCHAMMTVDCILYSMEHNYAHAILYLPSNGIYGKPENAMSKTCKCMMLNGFAMIAFCILFNVPYFS